MSECGIKIDVEQIVLGDRLEGQSFWVREIDQNAGGQRVRFDIVDTVPAREPIGDDIEESRVPPLLRDLYPQSPSRDMADVSRRKARHSARRSPWQFGCAALRRRSRQPE